MLKITVSNNWETRELTFENGPIELGRLPSEQVTNQFIVKDPHVSKQQVLFELTPQGNVKLTNLSGSQAIYLDDDSSIDPGLNLEVRAPFKFIVGRSEVRVAIQTYVEDMSPEAEAKRAKLQTVAAPMSTEAKTAAISALSSLGDAPTAEQLAQWFETVIQVQRAAAGSTEFYEATARAVVDLVGLDVGMVLLRQDGNWRIVGHHSTDRGEDLSFSRTTVNHVAKEKRTFYHGFGSDAQLSSASLTDAKAVVASPIFNESGSEVIGAVYGSASLFGFGRSSEIRPLEAQIVQVLASAVGIGISRMEFEAEATRRRVQFEQFFSPVLARELDKNPHLLEGHERQITMLFSDIRGFSRLSEILTPQDICKLIQDLMGSMTIRVIEQGGVVVDYYGDGMCAMWNAPVEQPNHGELACKAAQAMINDLPDCNERWESIIGAPLKIGVGLNTGSALVGNTGTQRKFKYGALGDTVNMASRIEGATKQLGVSCLISEKTALGLSEQYNTRRLGSVKVVGMKVPAVLYELFTEGDLAQWNSLKESFETALQLFENKQFDACKAAIQPFTEPGTPNHDLASENLVYRADYYLQNPDVEFEPVLELKSK